MWARSLSGACDYPSGFPTCRNAFACRPFHHRHPNVHQDPNLPNVWLHHEMRRLGCFFHSDATSMDLLEYWREDKRRQRVLFSHTIFQDQIPQSCCQCSQKSRMYKSNLVGPKILRHHDRNYRAILTIDLKSQTLRAGTPARPPAPALPCSAESSAPDD